jgi:hypothetical protein
LTLYWLFAVSMLVSTVASAKPVLHFSGAHGVPVEMTEYHVSQPHSRPLVIDLAFSPADADRLHRLMNANVGERITAAIDGHEVMTPVVRDVPTGASLELTLPDQATFAAVTTALGADR